MSDNIFDIIAQEPEEAPIDLLMDLERPPVQQTESPPIPSDPSEHPAWVEAWFRAHFPDKFIDDHSINELTEEYMVGAASKDELVVLYNQGVLSKSVVADQLVDELADVPADIQP